MISHFLDHATDRLGSATAVEASRLHPHVVTTRLDRQALVHDGVAQVLGATLVGGLPGPALVNWLDDEIGRLELLLDGNTAAALSIPEHLAILRHELSRRGIELRLDVDDVQPGPERVADVVASIVKESAINLVKHCTTTSISCTVREASSGLTVVVAPAGPVAPASATPWTGGSGRDLMDAMAATIGARVLLEGSDDDPIVTSFHVPRQQLEPSHRR